MGDEQLAATAYRNAAQIKTLLDELDSITSLLEGSELQKAIIVNLRLIRKTADEQLAEIGDTNQPLIIHASCLEYIITD